MPAIDRYLSNCRYGNTRYYAGSLPIAVVPGASRRSVVDDPLADYFPRLDGNIANLGFALHSDVRIQQTANTCLASPMAILQPNDVSCAGNYVSYTNTQVATSASDVVADCAIRCTSDDECESFSFSQAGQCYLWTSFIGGFSTADSCSCMLDASCDDGRRVSCTYRNICVADSRSSSECTSFTCSSCTTVIAGHYERRVSRDCVVNGQQCTIDDSCTDADADGEPDESPVWSQWSLCLDIDACGVGAQSRTATIIQRQRGMGAACPPLVDHRNCNTTTSGALAPVGTTVSGDPLQCFDAPISGHRYEPWGSTNRVGSEITIDVDGSCTASSLRFCSTLGSTQAENMAHCAQLCAEEPTCESANFKWSGSGTSAIVRCNLYTGTIGEYK